MVDKDSRLAIEDRVRQRLSRVSADSATVSEEANEYEHRFVVVPKSTGHCWFSVSVGRFDTYGLCFGHGLAIESLSISAYPPEEIIAALLSGNVSEDIWEWKGQILKVKGTVNIRKDAQLFDSAYNHPLSLLWWISRKRRVHYLAFDKK